MTTSPPPIAMDGSWGRLPPPKIIRARDQVLPPRPPDPTVYVREIERLLREAEQRNAYLERENLGLRDQITRLEKRLATGRQTTPEQRAAAIQRGIAGAERAHARVTELRRVALTSAVDFDVVGHQLVRGKDCLHLDPAAYLLLLILAEQRGTVVSFEAISQAVYDRPTGNGTIRARVFRLRQQMQSFSVADLVVFRDGGYCLEEEAP